MLAGLVRAGVRKRGMWMMGSDVSWQSGKGLSVDGFPWSYLEKENVDGSSGLAWVGMVIYTRVLGVIEGANSSV